MLFNSLAYAVFLPIVFILYWILPGRFRWAGLLAASWWFMANLDLRFLAVLMVTTVLSYGLGLALGSTEHRKGVLAVGILALAGILAFFKYTNFFIENFNAVLAQCGSGHAIASLSLILPVGISFYTFQTMGYVIDVYRGRIEPEKHFGYYALFVSFFPSLVSGPIGRASELLPQYRSASAWRLKAEDVSRGLKMIAWGYFMKLCIADTFAPYIDKVYADPDTYAGLICLIAPILYSFEIYCDFAGYSLIAIGSARLFGVRLGENFRSPYCSQSVREFWGRWHISLSSWLRDYLYIPLGGSRCSRLRHCINLMVTFLVSGLWHGASWTFVLWGGIHGVYQVIESFFRPSYNKKKAAAASMKTQNRFLSLVRTFVTFALVTFAWMFFKADRVSQVLAVLSRITVCIDDPILYLKNFVICMGASYEELAVMAALLLLLIISDILGRNRDLTEWTAHLRPVIKYPLYILFLVVLTLASQKGVTTGFIYSAF